MSTNTEKCCDASNNDKANSLFSKGHSISCSKICSITWVLGFEIAIFLVKIFMCIVDFSISWGKTSEYNVHKWPDVSLSLWWLTTADWSKWQEYN